MPSQKQLSLSKGRLAAQEIPVAQHVPYLRHVDTATIVTREGYYVRVIEIQGMSFETADQWHINQRMIDRATVLQGIADSRIAIYSHIIRTEALAFPAGNYANAWAESLDTAYKKKIETQKMFRTRQYLTIVRRPAQGRVNLLPKLIDLLASKVDAREQATQRKEALEQLEKVSGQILKTFSPYDARLLTMQEDNVGLHSETLGFLHYLLNLEESPRVAVSDMELSQYLPASRISFGKETFEMRGASPDALRLGAVLSLKQYPGHSIAGMLDRVLRLPHEFIITQSFAFMGRQAALDHINLQHRKIQSGDEGAYSIAHQLTEAVDDTASGHSYFGWHHMSIVPHAHSQKGLRDAINALLTACSEVGMIPVREDLNMEATFWAQLPGNFGYITRRAMVTNHNFAGFASYHTFASGRPQENHWGDAISLLATTSGAPFYFNFHVRDVGNTTVIGPTGTGKTVLLSFLAAQALRHTPRIFYFDKDRGADLFIRAVGGKYSVVEQGKPSGFNPLQLPDTPENRSFLIEFLRVLATMDQPTPLTASDERQIAAAVNANYQVPLAERNLRQLSAYFSGYESTAHMENNLEQRLAKWYGRGERAWLFDNNEDALSLDNPIIGFDLTAILDLPYARIPWLMYVFWRIDQLLDGTKTMIILDEGWKLLDDPIFASRIKDWEKTIRKLNGLLVFATQSAGDAIQSKIGATIIEQSPTQIFLPNAKAPEEEYCRSFGLTQKELQLIRTLSPESHQFLLKQGQHSVIAKFDLSGLPDEIAVLSGRADSVRLCDTIRQEVGENPTAWLPVFHERRKSL